MTGPPLQLFPPPPRPPRQTSPPNRNLRIKPPTPEPAAAKMDSAKSSRAPADFHELIIQVNSVPVSPSSSMAPPPPPPPPVAPPPRAHVPSRQAMQTPPTEGRAVFGSPQRPGASSPLRRPQDPMVPSPSISFQVEQSRYQTPNSTPDPNRAMSPAFSTSPTLVRANSAATHFRSRSPQEEVPMRSIFPVYDPTKPLTQQAYKPTQASPTHIPKNQISRSPYSPEFYVPHGNVAGPESSSPTTKPFFTPSHLLDNLWVAANGQEQPAVQMYTLRMHRATAANPTITFGTTPSLPFYSLAQSNLAGEDEVQSIMNELLIQRHHPTQPRVLPIAHLDLIAPPSLSTTAFDPNQQESTTLLTSIYPKLAALQALDAAAASPAVSHIALADPGATSPAAQRLAEDVLMGAAQRECCALAWTRDPPQQQTNPWAQHLPSEGSYQLHHPTLGTFPIKIEGDCSVINKPSTRPVTAIYGHNMASTPQPPRQKPASISIMNPYILSPTSPRANAFSPLQPPPRFDSLGQEIRPVSITPSEMSVTQLPTTTDATQDDATLAKLDFANDALTLNLGALTRFGNPFLVDVVASTLLAVAVAEAVRGRNKKAQKEDFQPPPPSYVLNKPKDSTAKAFKESFVEGFESFGGKPKPPATTSSLRKWSLRSGGTSRTSSKSDSFDKDIELGDWHGQAQTKQATKEDKKAQKKQKEEADSKLPFVTRTIINVLTFAFKAVVFVMRIAIKVVAGVIVMITRNFSKL
ncbi:hypothetical protein BS50DRAFT_569454 [Corynespora cassiicola Philippines]|uniref:Uncharacterized protein n=1 Tax=Corynespora cassiicola Philippines TaxID=1448308 RepID=A0A2T2P2G2_CORCC|nr:hypothetical protein BS50DRAFT_569454 [Corynespora cassiicola Philippines]